MNENSFCQRFNRVYLSLHLGCSGLAIDVSNVRPLDFRGHNKCFVLTKR